MSGLTLLQITKHCQESMPDIASGVVLGMERDGVLEVTHSFGEAPRNTVSWAPHGRFLALAGFGNMSGELSFYDRKTLKCMGTVRTAARAERLRVAEALGSGNAGVGGGYYLEVESNSKL